jgi:hypothetical protein
MPFKTIPEKHQERPFESLRQAKPFLRQLSKPEWLFALSTAMTKRM